MYGIFISLSIFCCIILAEKLARDRNLNLKFFWAMAFWTVLGGIAGARIYHVIDFWDYYSTDPITIFYLQGGGLAIYGALAGGATALFLILKRANMTKKEVLHLLDIIGVVLPLGQAIGRWGNFFNLELFGKPTNLPWGIYIPPQFRPSEYTYYDVFHPLFFYEMVLNLLLFVAGFVFYRLKAKSNFKPGYLSAGTSFGLYLIGYGLIRFFLDFLRVSPWTINVINISQLISLIFIVAGFYFTNLIKRKNS